MTQNVQTYATIIDALNPELRLKPSMTATVTVAVARRENIVQIPNGALRFRPTPAMFETLGQAAPPELPGLAQGNGHGCRRFGWLRLDRGTASGTPTAHDGTTPAHELVGIGFSVAVVLHVLTHWRSFSNYFAQRRAVGVLALAWSAGIGLVMAQAILGTGEPEELILDRIDRAPVNVLAPAIGMDVRELIDRLGNDGFMVDDPGMSIRQLAARYGAETDDLLFAVVRQLHRGEDSE